VLVSLRYGHTAAVMAALFSVAALDFIFIQPYLTFWVADPRDAVTLAVMFVVALIVATLTKRVRDQAEAARSREVRTAALYAMSRELAGTTGIGTMLRIAARHLHDAFECRVAVLLPESGGLSSAVHSPRTFEIDQRERVVAEWVWQNERAAGWGTDESPASQALFLLLRGSRGKVGILLLKPPQRRPIDTGLLQLVRTFAAQLGSALERGQLAEAAHRAEVQIETERLRSSLLSSVSHDLRAPLRIGWGPSCGKNIAVEIRPCGASESPHTELHSPPRVDQKHHESPEGNEVELPRRQGVITWGRFLTPPAYSFGSLARPYWHYYGFLVGAETGFEADEARLRVALV